ncbi:hypothetical protein HanRHA438_Chr02g0063331 [Helianthus annuus]|nr:hypothetical protein HanRHA438_Chr02g0063331 [Helianthus annuus]
MPIHIQPIKICEWSFYNVKSIKSGCEWRREKMVLFICIFEGTLFTHYNFLIYFESDCEWRREKT